MPATYTYNDAIEDAKRCVMQAWEEKFDEAKAPDHMDLAIAIVGRLEKLKRRPRHKRTPKSPVAGDPLAKIIDEDRLKGPARW